MTSSAGGGVVVAPAMYTYRTAEDGAGLYSGVVEAGHLQRFVEASAYASLTSQLATLTAERDGARHDAEHAHGVLRAMEKDLRGQLSAATSREAALRAELRARDKALAEAGDAHRALVEEARNSEAALREALVRAERIAEIAEAQRRQEAFKNESLISLLVSFRLAVPPAPFEKNGVTYRFVPPDPHLYLEQLRKAIEAAEANEQIKQDARLCQALAGKGEKIT